MMASATFRGGMLGLLGQDQGQVGGQVAVLRLLGGLHFEGGQGLKSQLARGPGLFGAGRDQITDGFFKVHFYSTFFRMLLMRKGDPIEMLGIGCKAFQPELAQAFQSRLAQAKACGYISSRLLAT